MAFGISLKFRDGAQAGSLTNKAGRAAPDNVAGIDLTRRIWFTTGMAGGLNSKRKKRTIHGAVTIDDVALRWELTSEPQWSNSGDGYKGLCISVEVADEARRELIIEYPYPKGRDGRPLPVPQRPTVTPKLVEQAIGDALNAGWDPSSRGKAFVYCPAEGS